MQITTSRMFRTGVLLCLLTLLFGVGLGGVFGVAEDNLKALISNRYDTGLSNGVFEAPADGGAALRDKSWTYIKRAHLHANGMGAAGLGLALALLIGCASCRLGGVTMMAAGIGGLAYPLYWLLAGFTAPGLGSTGAAKSALRWLALPSSGLFILAIVAGVITAACACMKVAPVVGSVRSEQH